MPIIISPVECALRLLLLCDIDRYRLIDSHSMIIQNGSTSLIVAAIGGHASVVTLLLDAKADVDLADIVRHLSVE